MFRLVAAPVELVMECVLCGGGRGTGPEGCQSDRSPTRPGETGVYQHRQSPPHLHLRL